MNERQLVGAIVGVVGLAGALVQRANAETHAHFRVTAQVAGMAAMERAQVPAVVSVTPAARASGRVRARVYLTVRTNAADGYVVTFWPRAHWFESLQVAGLGAPVELPADGGSVVRHNQTPGLDRLELEISFALRRGVEDDELPWPVEFAVTPL